MNLSLPFLEITITRKRREPENVRDAKRRGCTRDLGRAYRENFERAREILRRETGR